MNNPAKYYNPKLIPSEGACWFFFFFLNESRSLWMLVALRRWQWKSNDIFFWLLLARRGCTGSRRERPTSHISGLRTLKAVNTERTASEAWKETGLLRFCFFFFRAETAQREARGLVACRQDKARFLYSSGFSTEYISRPRTPGLLGCQWIH